ncbi:MAG: DUF4105 domain-containing protein [Flavobacteriaceae bacterium]
MRSKLHCLILLFFCCYTAICQTPGLSPEAQISVITCGPGNELYTAFGHSAFRVQDAEMGLDLVYNYGTFDFNAPNFYMNFARGKPIFTLSRSRFVNFLYTYQLESRWVKEQILDLDTEEKNRIFLFLEDNYKPENRNYKYDYIKENCSTKIPEVLSEVLGTSLVFKEDHLNESKSFRELMQSHLLWNSWGSIGIDLGLGAVIDREASPIEHMFLPDYVLLQMNNTTLEGKPLVDRQRTILDLNNGQEMHFFTSSPLFWVLLLCIFTVTITFIDIRNQTRSRRLDFVLFSMSGALGILIVFLWFFTDHNAAALNFNILWAFPVNTVIAFYVLRKEILPAWIPKYVNIVLVLLIILVILWLAGLQGFHPLALLIALTLGIRYLFLYFYFKKVYPVWARDIWKTKRS